MAESKEKVATDLSYEYLCNWLTEPKLPVVYHGDYNINVFGMEKWSKFDAWKLDKIFWKLIETGVLKSEQQHLIQKELSLEALSKVHSKDYLMELQTSRMALVRLTEIPSLLLLPNFIAQRRILYPLKLQATGTVIAVKLAVKIGWAINIGGGMIHACYDKGSAWSPYDDITLAIHFARNHFPKIKKTMIIDFGAHQGNGYASNKLKVEDKDTIIVDVYNEMIFPQDLEARKAINVERKLACGTSSEAYMEAVKSALKEASQFVVDLILYAAGSNVLEADYSGQIKATAEDLLLRDELVFRFALENKTPICMVTSSGYGQMNFDTVSKSIENLIKNVCN
eukprot:g1103.t1